MGQLQRSWQCHLTEVHVYRSQQVEKLHDEGVQLKTLQTTLTLLQSPQHAHLEDSICAVLGICFRLLANARNSDSVVSTAAATVRQVPQLLHDREVSHCHVLTVYWHLSRVRQLCHVRKLTIGLP